MATTTYINAKCGQCTYWKVSRNPLGTCRLNPEHQATIGRYGKACGAFELEISMKNLPLVEENPLKENKR